jgi:hypothetical protein
MPFSVQAADRAVNFFREVVEPYEGGMGRPTLCPYGLAMRPYCTATLWDFERRWDEAISDCLRGDPKEEWQE